mmetsp:Transcript_7912/g.21655  ORF Transcript_7912/g.21655 Transcript_7912/m.21655 type:complete len:270 (-) Transcript_7912:101-910(-)
MAATAGIQFHGLPQDMQPAKVNTRSLMCATWHPWGAAAPEAGYLSTEPAKVRSGKSILNLDELTRPVPAEKVMPPSFATHGTALVGEQLISLIEDFQDIAQIRWSPAPVKDLVSATQADNLLASPASTSTSPSVKELDSTSAKTDEEEEEVNELSSIGSGLHYSGRCRPCTWAWSEKGCTHGARCSFCHFRHEMSDKNLRRPCKGKRAYYRKLLGKIADSRGQTLVDNRKTSKVEPMLENEHLLALSHLQSLWLPPVPPPPGLVRSFSE